MKTPEPIKRDHTQYGNGKESPGAGSFTDVSV